MITKIGAIESKGTIWRSALQKTTNLKNLAGSGMSPGFHIPRVGEMVIPGGMTKAETFVYKLTGKVPFSVKNRWYENGLDGRQAQEGDQVLTLTDGQVTTDPHYVDTDFASHDFGTGADDDTSIGDILDGLG